MTSKNDYSTFTSQKSISNNFRSIEMDDNEHTDQSGNINDETVELNVDPHGLGDSSIGTNAALMNLLKGNIGTGILAMPSVVMYAGLALGTLLILIVGVISTYLMHVLLRCADDLVTKHGIKRSQLDYTQTVYYVFKFAPERISRYRNIIKHTTTTFMIITQVGFCCAYLLFISQNITFFIKDYFSTNTSLYYVAAIVMVILLSMCWIKNLRIIARVALFANLSALIGIILLFVYVLMDLQDWRLFPTYKSFNDILIAFGIVIFAFEAINLILPIQSKMKYPDRYVSPTGVVNTSMVFVVCLYAGMGFFGYLCFGEGTLGSITFNLPNRPLWLSPIKPMFIFSILVSYLLQLYVPVIIITQIIEKAECYHLKSHFWQKFIRRIIPFLIVIFSYCFAISIPKLDLMLALLGAVSSTYLALMCPPILNMVSKISDPDLPRNITFKLGMASDIAIFIFSFIGFIGGTASAIMALIKND